MQWLLQLYNWFYLFIGATETQVFSILKLRKYQALLKARVEDLENGTLQSGLSKNPNEIYGYDSDEIYDFATGAVIKFYILFL